MKFFFNKNNKLILTALTLLVFAILYCQTINPSWKSHLEIDSWVWYQRIDYFRKHNNSFANLEGNELLPATLLFLFVPTIFSNLSKINYGFYLKGVLAINFFIIFLHILLCRKQTNFLQTLLFLMIVLFIGPIMFFRFDSLITLLVLLSIWFWRQKKLVLSGFSLGWATAMKVFPIIFLPYFLLILWFDHKRGSQIISYLISFIISMLVPLLVFFSIGGSFEQVSEALNFHALKYVSIESVPGNLLTGISLIFNKKPLPLLGGYGVWGVKSKFIDTIGLEFFNYLWILPVGIFYLFLISKKSFLKKLHVGVLFWLMMLFLVFSKNLHPQYIFWFIALFPFLKVKARGYINYLIMFFFIIIIALLNQNIYPRLYTSFIEEFYSRGQQTEIFYLQFLRNLSIILLLVFSFKNLLLKKSIE